MSFYLLNDYWLIDWLIDWLGIDWNRVFDGIGAQGFWRERRPAAERVLVGVRKQRRRNLRAVNLYWQFSIKTCIVLFCILRKHISRCICLAPLLFAAGFLFFFHALKNSVGGVSLFFYNFPLFNRLQGVDGRKGTSNVVQSCGHLLKDKSKEPITRRWKHERGIGHACMDWVIPYTPAD